MENNEAIEQILELGFLGAIAEDDLLSLRPAPQLLSVRAGDTLLLQGEPGEAYYLLLRGRVRRFANDESGGRRFVGDVFPGQGVGASGLLTDDGNATTARVMHDSEVVRFSRAAFLQLMVLSWEFAIGVCREQIERVKAAEAPTRRHPTIKNVAIVPLDAAVDASRFIDDLFIAVDGIATVTTVDDGLLTKQMAPPPITAQDQQPTTPSKADIDAVVARIEGFERQHDIVLYLVSPAADVWSQLIVARADLVLLVSSVGGESDLCEIETLLIEPTDDELRPRVDLALVHDSEWSADCQTRRWLDVRQVDEWHHLRAHREEDFQRLARVLTGNAITLVLGGGGARGLAEIGVYKALHEAGIPIDRFAGTSMGAMIGALLAAGMDTDEVTETLRTWAKKGTPGRDYTFPAMSLVHAKKLHKATQEVLGDGNIEDLPKPFFCLSANLSEIRPKVHDCGVLWRAVRASMSVPGVGPPLFDQGLMLTDGGTVSNVPADFAAQRHAGRIIIVVVTLAKKFLVPESYDDLVPSGWQILWHRINPFLKPLTVPNIYEVLQRSAAVGSNESYRKARELADLAILPPVSHVTLLDFHEIDSLIEAGYEHTVAQLKSIGREGLRDLFPGIEALSADTSSIAEAAPPIDRTRFNEILGADDDETFRQMLDVFIEMFPAEIEGLASAMASGADDQTREYARRAKSAAADVAAPALTALLHNIETRVGSAEPKVLSDTLDRIQSEFKRIAAYSHRS